MYSATSIRFTVNMPHGGGNVEAEKLLPQECWWEIPTPSSQEQHGSGTAWESDPAAFPTLVAFRTTLRAELP